MYSITLHQCYNFYRFAGKREKSDSSAYRSSLRSTISFPFAAVFTAENIVRYIFICMYNMYIYNR